MSVRIETVPEHGGAPLLAVARALVAEYAALPHTVGRWSNAAADIAALPQPFVAPRGALLVALDDGGALGCGALRHFEPGIVEIKRMYVRPAARGRGVGEALLRALLHRAAHLGYDRVRLDTAPELLAARALYGRLGFEPIPHYQPGLLPDTLCFERVLGARET
ncbi:MAG: GNAT family N-acetyltransferase [Gemmatimonadaceae bacterium]|nr:GNAT family N-acetyltransferase [Gemmatimonadaceae bacterium]